MLLLVQPQQLTGAAAQTVGLSSSACRQVGFWLAGCSGWVFSMVVLGGMTRLTRSGLSMTDWKFTGERSPQSLVHTAMQLHTSYIPCVTLCICLHLARSWTGHVVVLPLYLLEQRASQLTQALLSSQADWEAEFRKYKQSPEFRKVNR